MDALQKSDHRRRLRRERSQMVRTLEARCRELGITNKDLAQMVPIVSKSKISRVFNGYTDFTTLEAEQISAALREYAMNVFHQDLKDISLLDAADDVL